MSELSIRQVEIKAFKAFQQFDFKLDGRNLLVYGANGSGKSSLYWALYTFLQSAQKETKGITKYFDENQPENLLNLHSQESDEAAITITLQNTDASDCSSYTISKKQHGTMRNSNILKGNLASDFINYRILFNFYHFTNSQSIDLWPVFEREILPFCQSPNLHNVYDHWKALQMETPYGKIKREKKRAKQATEVYVEFSQKIKELNTALTEILSSITKEAQDFYDQHFAEADGQKIQLIVGLTRTLDYNRNTRIYSPPVIGFEIKINGKKIHKPHSFLNEAKLTQLALSIRFGATLAHLQESPFKLLVLDDLLISLDMSNRMKVVDIILSDTFADYQKIILTHDLGFFREFRRKIGNKHTEWSFQRFTEDSKRGFVLKEEKTDLQKAEDYLSGQNLEEAAVYLRKAAEDMAKQYREWLEHKELPPGDFRSLTENLRAARNKLSENIPKQLYEKVLRTTRPELREYLIPINDDDVGAIESLSAANKGRLKTQRTRLRNLIKSDGWKNMKNIDILDEILETTERVLNPGAHNGTEPLYDTEVKKALELVKKLENCLP